MYVILRLTVEPLAAGGLKMSGAFGEETPTWEIVGTSRDSFQKTTKLEFVAVLEKPGGLIRLTASGDVFEPYTEYTAASPYLPFGTVLLVCYSGCVEVVITDRGPYYGGRELDLSAIAAEEIGLTHAGVDYVEVY